MIIQKRVNHQLLGGVLKYLGAVEEVTIEECKEIRCLWESDTEASKVLVNLRILDVHFCSNLVSLGEKDDENCASNLTSLRRLEVWYCHSLENVSCPNSIESLKLHGCDSITSVFFPTEGRLNLKSLSIVHCKKLWEKDLKGGQKTRVLINSTIWMLEFVRLSYFIHLTKLKIEDCPHMESFPYDELPNHNVLERLTIVNCPSMDASFPCGLWPPKLCFLNIGGLKKPISEWGPQNFPNSLVELHLRSIPSEDVSNFSQLSHLLPSSLTTLGIIGFEKLESISMGLQHLTSLQHLSISKCPKTKDLPEKLLPSLLCLRIFLCPNLKKSCSRRGSYWPLISPLPCFNIHG
uniref:Uncharacterized protein n=1 Tax=Lactuca sativa TaxID=4236 RepID=A0A9R1XKE4_LACSA|nr:hypothetical protein LSAT_V11C300148180 [Lactuca sativa]